MKNTDLNLIPIFVAIFEEQNLSKAAARLDISQPAVSKALARLRDIYDEPLFHRSPSGVEPTSFAVDIYPAMLTAFKTSPRPYPHPVNLKPKCQIGFSRLLVCRSPVMS